MPMGGTYLALTVACLWLTLVVLLPIFLVMTLQGSSLLHPDRVPGVSLQVPFPRSGLTRCVLSGLLALRQLVVSCGLDENGLPLQCTWGVSGLRHFIPPMGPGYAILGLWGRMLCARASSYPAYLCPYVVVLFSDSGRVGVPSECRLPKRG